MNTFVQIVEHSVLLTLIACAVGELVHRVRRNSPSKGRR